jgi:hypothetical protein
MTEVLGIRIPHPGHHVRLEPLADRESGDQVLVRGFGDEHRGRVLRHEARGKLGGLDVESLELGGIVHVLGARLDPVGLPDLEPSRPPFDDTGVDVWELRELRRGDHTRRTRTHDEHVHLVGRFGRSIDAVAGGWPDPRVTRYVAVVMELHRAPHSRTGEWFSLFDIRIHSSYIE